MSPEVATVRLISAFGSASETAEGMSFGAVDYLSSWAGDRAGKLGSSKGEEAFADLLVKIDEFGDKLDALLAENSRAIFIAADLALIDAELSLANTFLCTP